MALIQLQETIKIAGVYSMLHEIELDFLFNQVSSAGLPDGAILCAGVWKGGDVVVINLGLKSAGLKREIVVIDSFEGVAVPEPSDLETDDPVMEGDLSPGIGEFDKTMDLFGVKQLDIYVFFVTEKSIAFVGERKLAMIWLDLDHYQPTLTCMKRFYPWLSNGGMMLTHDYALSRTPGVRKAADEFGGEWFYCAGGIWGIRKH